MVTIAQLSAIPYLDTSQLNGRFIPGFCFYDGGWRMWLIAGEKQDQLIETWGSPAEACYFAAAPQAETDFASPFINFLAQRASFLSVKRAFSGILDDIWNLSSSLAKFDLLESSEAAVPQGLSRMVVSEVEYLLTVCRSLFDLLQEVIAKLWDTITLLDPKAQKRAFKKSFADMVMFKGVASDANTIPERFCMPREIAACYERARTIFDRVKNLRDNIVHNGTEIPHIFSDRGTFLISRSNNPFPEILIYADEECRANELVPLKPLLETMIYRTLLACDDFSSVLSSVIQFPSPLVPTMQFFIRGFFTNHLVSAIGSSTARADAALNSRRM